MFSKITRERQMADCKPKLSRIVIENYKSIKSLDINLEKLLIMVGKNGVGKSNFISFFELISSIVNKNLNSYALETVGSKDKLFYLGDTTKEIKASLYFKNDDKEEIYDISIELSNNDELIVYREKSPHIDSMFKDFVAYRFNDTSHSAPARKNCHLHDNAFFRKDASNLAAFLYLLQEKYPENYNKIVKSIQEVEPYFANFNLKPMAANPDMIKLEWQQEGSDIWFSTANISEGTLKFICLATVLLQPNPPDIIAIDDPYVGLYFGEKNLLSEIIKDFSKQLIITSNHQTINNINDVIVTKNLINGSAFKKASEV